MSPMRPTLNADGTCADHSDMRRAVVIEINEIPPRLLRWYAERTPNSAVAELLRTSVLAETVLNEEPERGLYPSQSWATLAMGVPHDKHGVYWYGDPKPADLPLYWQAIAKTRRVGVFGTLHSSPLNDTTADLPGAVFAVPDVFGDDPNVLPTTLGPLHRFNLRMTRQNGRAVDSAAPVADYMDGLRALRGSGIRVRTLVELGMLAGRVAAGRASKERLRTAQFLLLADAFEAQLDASRPDLAVFFTNHVAASMHRYWPATFPDDWDVTPNGPEWVARHEAEIPAAMDALDGFLGRVLRWCQTHDRSLVLVSSMGQTGGGEVDQGGDRTLVVDDPRTFASALGVAESVELKASMVPHLTFDFDDEERAASEQQRLSELPVAGSRLQVDRSRTAVTITYHLDDATDLIDIDGQQVRVSEAGLRWVAVTEHKSGVHHPIGTLLVANSPQAALPSEPVDVLEVAPALLSLLGAPALDHHVDPSFSLG